jgi:hypothetical protein
MKCFCCGMLMNSGEIDSIGYCPACEVWEVRWSDPYIPLVRTVHAAPAGHWAGLRYLDHSRGHYPSPA